MPVYKNPKNLTWFCKFYYTDQNGERKQKWKRGFRTKHEALEYEKQFTTNTKPCLCQVWDKNFFKKFSPQFAVLFLRYSLAPLC
ncbi:MAG: Arm DNA-binding domain-containing protein [Lachnospiraceae bacterium]|nr:Arm DNA-binding domain-containing protein [Lachnospiraceae bacterium]